MVKGKYQPVRAGTVLLKTLMNLDNIEVIRQIAGRMVKGKYQPVRAGTVLLKTLMNLDNIEVIRQIA
ncbi:hypothetical protein D8Y27_25625, partial [Escherichia coli]